jgi:hypothetical protein
MYWQLVLPRNEHVIAGPEGFTPECRWGWNGLFWGRVPLIEQPELEAWCGATRRGDDVPKATSRYLFSSWGPVQQCELRTASRWLIVLGASSAVLAVGLVLIYVPRSRHPASLVAAAVLLLGAALIYPEPALLALQAASLGLALVFLAALLHRTLARGRHGGRRPEAFSSILDRGSTQAHYRPPLAGNQSPTESAPVPQSMPSPGSES